MVKKKMKTLRSGSLILKICFLLIILAMRRHNLGIRINPN